MKWAHDVGEIVDANGETSTQVHVYAKPWSLLPAGFTALVGEEGAFVAL